VQQALETAAAAYDNISLIPDMVAIDLVTGRHVAQGPGEKRVHGVYAVDRADGSVKLFTGRATILATGGASRAWLYSTNPRGSTGDGIAMAWRAGCRVSNMEFNQFHPTCLHNHEVKNFLITEAMRGEGGQLRIPGSGHRFMPDFDPRAELASRDIVARAIDHELKRLGLDFVHLDISHRDPDFVRQHFPTIAARLAEPDIGIDITREPIPVVPAAHYTCGGVVTDLDACTDLPGLYAAGEVTQSGLHGANRLASNSVLECLVFGLAAAAHIGRTWAELPPPPAIRPWDESRVTHSDEEVVVHHNWREIRRFMWDYVGIVRTTKRLERALNRVSLLRQETEEYYGNFRVTPDLIELRNLVEVSELIVRSALTRQESRGLHYTLDYPELLPDAVDTVLSP
jgi:L-aspartate oxidase